MATKKSKRQKVEAPKKANIPAYIPSIDELIHEIEKREKDFNEIMAQQDSEDSDESYYISPPFGHLESATATPFDFLLSAASVILPYLVINRRTTDSLSKATAVFRGYMALTEVKNRRDMRQYVCLVKGLCKEYGSDEYTEHAWVEYKDGQDKDGQDIRRFNPTFKQTLEEISRHFDNAENWIEALKNARDPAHIYEDIRPAVKSGWGNEELNLRVPNHILEPQKVGDC